MNTSDKVIRRTGAETLPNYSDVTSLTDSAGFSVQRPYPPNTPLSEVRTRDGRHVVVCLIYLVVERSHSPTAVRRVRLYANLHDRSYQLRRWPARFNQEGFADPDFPTADSLARYQRARKPLSLNFEDDYVYDGAQDEFLDKHGRRARPEDMLDSAFEKHCRTYRLGFRARWLVGSTWRFVLRKAIWRGQDICLWLLVRLYDIEFTIDDKKRRDPFHIFKLADFQRTTEKPEDRSHFFGFQSSRKSLFTNLVVLAVTCLLLYWTAPRTELLRVIYHNTAFTTAALVLGFLVADVLGPNIFIGVICALSRLRPMVIFFTRKVRV